ncbi:MAG TPA: hypothetical protein VK631_15575 [Solirubrobacteraceae bacterium]|nr:hypothetical protein [Solirubrobacteraceae bacterium]
MARHRLPLSAVAVAAPSLLWLHAVHMVAGHEWFSNYGLIAAACPAAIVAYGALARHGTRWVSIGAAAAMLLFFIVVEWLEGELTAGHRLAWPTLADHGWPILMTAGLALASLMTVESLRLIRMLRGVVTDR